jgi:acetyl esterase/lipase
MYTSFTTLLMALLTLAASTHPAPRPAASAPAAQAAPGAQAAPAGANYQRTKDIIYGRSYGTSLTMDVLTPAGDVKPNGVGVIWIVSGGWFSSPESIQPATIELFAGELLRRGYTVFAVCHGSQPKFTIPEAVNDINRAVRYIRYHAEDYSIDPDRIGVYGASAGGHLTMMMGCAPQPENPKAPDPVDRTSSKVQCVACFFPPTDFLNYGEQGKPVDLEKGVLAPFKAAFDFREYDGKSKRLLPVTDPKRIEQIERSISPIYGVDPADPPALIIQGDNDVLVPYQQATTMIDKLKAAGVDAKLITRKGGGHGWTNFDKDMVLIADWFDAHLRNVPATTAPAATAPATASQPAAAR